MSIGYEDTGNGVFVVTLNRPERMNALDSASKRALGDIWRSAEAAPEVRALVIRGMGDKAFCAGSDIKEIKETGKMVTTELLAYALPTVGVELTKPLVAALHGFAIGMGLSLAIHCDMRIAAPGTRLGWPEVQHGMLSGITTITLPSIVGEANALDLMLSGRIVTAQEAREMGLINAIAEEPYREALEIARRMAANSSVATRLTKRLLLAERKRRFVQHLEAVDRARDGVTESAEYAAVVSNTPGTGRIRSG